MKQVIRILLILAITFLIVFAVVANLNLIGKDEFNIKTIIYGNSFFIFLIVICIIAFCALGYKKK